MRGARIRSAALPALLLLLAGVLVGCGRSTDRQLLPRASHDRPDDVRGRQIHFVYAVPAGRTGVDRRRDTDGTLTNSTYLMIGWLGRQPGSPRLRIDMYRGRPDITYVRLPHGGPYYVRGGPASLTADVAAAGLRKPGKLYPVYYEGALPQREADTCGLGRSGPGPFAIVFLGQSCPYDFDEVGFGYYSPLVFVMAHEILHELGFVPACAPHARGDSGHVGDNKRDLMYPIIGGRVPVLDVNHDDYYLAGVPGCPDLSRSPYVVLP